MPDKLSRRPDRNRPGNLNNKEPSGRVENPVYNQACSKANRLARDLANNMHGSLGDNQEGYN